MSVELIINDILFEEIPVGCSILNRKGIIIKYNKKCEDILEFKKNEVIGKRWDDVIYFDNNLKYRLLKSYNIKIPIVYDNINLMNKSMKFIPCKIKTFPIMENGEVSAIICFFDDISKRVKIERKLFEVEKAKFLEKISISIAHEIKNPLMIISGILGVMQSRQCGECFNYGPLESAINVIGTVSNIIDNFLYFAKVKDVKMELSDISEVINEVYDSYNIILIEHNIKFKLLLPDNMPQVCIDKNSIKQVLYNLIWNAKKIITNKGEITLSVKLLTKKDLRGCYLISKYFETPVKMEGTFLSYLSPMQYVFVSVTDNMGGLDIEKLSQYFSPFFSMRNKGIGLGLNVVRSLIDAHDGSILIQEIKGKKTMIGFILPYGSLIEEKPYEQ